MSSREATYQDRVTSLEEFAPHFNWKELGASDHSVQFYEDNSHLINSLKAYVSTGLKANENIIFIATPEHLFDLEKQLEKEFDISKLKSQGNYIALDAAETLSKFMVEGSVNSELFAQSLGELVKNTILTNRPLRAFGEMVALLWAEGNFDAAINLEKIWNDLRKKYDFSLLCAYPLNSFSGESKVNSFLHICEEHSHVIPAESYISKSSRDERLRSISALQQKAISLEAEIAEKNRLELNLLEQQAKLNLATMRTTQLQEAVDDLKAFSYGISHDMRAPLRCIQQYSSLLIEEFGKEMNSKKLELISQITSSSRNLDKLIQDILSYSAISHQDIKIRPVNLNKLVNDLVQQYQDFQIPNAKISINNPLLPVMGNEDALTRCLQNLLANAVKFMPPGVKPEVKVWTELLDKNVRLWIEDNGIGIFPKHLERVWRIFERVYPQKTYPGTGIGLSIVRKAIERMGGSVGVESEFNKGSKFWLEIPGVA